MFSARHVAACRADFFLHLLLRINKIIKRIDSLILGKRLQLSLFLVPSYRCNSSYKGSVQILIQLRHYMHRPRWGDAVVAKEYFFWKHSPIPRASSTHKHPPILPSGRFRGPFSRSGHRPINPKSTAVATYTYKIGQSAALLSPETHYLE